MERPSRRLRRYLAGIVAAAFIAVALVAIPPTSDPALAIVPPPDPGSALLHARIGDLRASAGDITALEGATFGLFLAEPSATIDENSGFAVPDAAHPVYFTCVSDADGDCVFQVPIRAGQAVVGADQTAPYANNAAANRGVPEGTRLFIAALAAPTGYYANPLWQTGPLSPSGQDPLVELRHVWQSPPLVANRSYLSGRDWITDPGLQTSPADPTRNFTRRIASSGTIVLSRDNPLLPEKCGFDVGLVVDVSSSVSGSQGQLVTAMNQFVDALRGTPSRMALLTFGTDSPANGFASNSPLTSVATTADATEFRNLYDDPSAPSGSNRDWDDPTFSWPTNYTNWDRGFAATATSNADLALQGDRFDLVVFLTDGNPTVYDANPLTASGVPRDPNSGYTRFREISNGLASANLVKEQGSRVLAVGVGAGINSPGAADNLRTVSGQIQYDGTNIADADYIQTADYAQAGAALRSLVLDNCAPSLSVIKRIVPDGGTVADAVLPADPWTFTATTPDPEVDIDGTPTQTELGTGGVSFPIAFDPATPTDFRGDIRIEEDISTAPQSAYTPLPEETVCVERSTGADVPLTITPDGDTAFSIDIGLQEMVTCTVYNQAPADVVAAAVVVHKLWRVISASGVSEVPDGAQLDGLAAGLRFTGPDSGAFLPQLWSQERTGYNASPLAPAEANTVQIGETVVIDPSLPLCEVTDVPLIRPGAPEAGTPAEEYTPLDPDEAFPLSAGTNEWTILNQVVCTSELTLLKDVTNGPLDSPEGEQQWTLEAVSPFADPPWNVGVSGTTGVSAEVVPGEPYPLREIRHIEDEHLTQHYLQHDLRSQPLLFPESSGSWDCRPQGNPGGDPSLGAEGAVIVPLGQHYECTARNTTALLSVTKTVLPEGDPLDFTFRAEFIPPAIVPEPLPHEFTQGAAQSLVPGQRYRLFELDSPGFTLTSLTCESGGTPFDPSDFALLFGADAQCAAVNQLGDWTAVKSSDPPSGSQVDPGDVVTYTVTADQLFEGGVSNDVEITDDLSGVLDDATLIAGSITTTSGIAEQVATSIVWSIDSLTGTEQLSFQVRVNDDAWSATLDNVITQNGGTDCASVPDDPGPFDADCDETHHPTPPEPPVAPPDGGLGATGGQLSPTLAIVVAALIMAGIALATLSAARRARRL